MIPARNLIENKKQRKWESRPEVKIRRYANRLRRNEIKLESIPDFLRDDVMVWMLNNPKSK